MQAPCPHYGKCSGCTLQQFPYVKQLADKAKKIDAILKPLSPIQPMVPSPDPLGYRTSSKLCLHEDDLGRRSIGLYARHSKNVVAIPHCAVHDPAINRLITKLFATGKPVPAPFYQHDNRKFQPGRLKFITVRYSRSTGTFGVVLSHTGVSRAELEAWALGLNLSQVALYESILSKNDDDLVMAHNGRHLAGLTTIEVSSVAVNPLVFFQANGSLFPRFVDEVVAGFSGKTLLDLYGGFGSYSFALTSQFEQVVLVETNPHAIDAAASFASQQGIDHFLAIAARAENFFAQSKHKKFLLSITHVIVNPPRAGLDPQVIAALLTKLPALESICYVSCNPDTLKRDLRLLSERGGLKIKSLVPFDMFPQTDHAEVVAKICR